MNWNDNTGANGENVWRMKSIGYSSSLFTLQNTQFGVYLGKDDNTASIVPETPVIHVEAHGSAWKMKLYGSVNPSTGVYGAFNAESKVTRLSADATAFWYHVAASNDAGYGYFEWSAPSPSVALIEANTAFVIAPTATNCPVPIIGNGTSGDCGATLAPAATCTPTCNEGYILQGVVTCSSGGTDITATAQCVPVALFRDQMNDVSSGTGFFHIKTIYNRWVTSLDGYLHKYPLNQGHWQGSFGIDWNDNTGTEAEIVWKLTAVGDSKTDFVVQNTQYTDSYIGKAKAPTHQYWNTPNPIIRIETAANGKWTMKLQGVSAYYKAFAWQGNEGTAGSAVGVAVGDYGYFDFETISTAEANSYFVSPSQAEFQIMETT